MSNVGGTFDDVTKILAERAGYGFATPEDLSDEGAELSIYLAKGYRNFIAAFDWSFLKPLATLVLFGTTTGTVVGSPSYSAPSSTVTATASKFSAQMVGQSLTFNASGNGYVVDGYTSATVVTVTGDASGEAPGDLFTLTPNGSYRLPVTHGGLIGHLYFETTSGWWQPIRLVGLGVILDRWMWDSTRDRPRIAAESPATVGMGSEQQFDLLVYPIPATDVTIKYRYYVRPQAIVPTDYPYGSPDHFETLVAMCLAELELGKFGGAGPLSQLADRALQISIRLDGRMRRPDSLGLEVPDGLMGRTDESYRSQTGAITYNGASYP